MTKNIEDRPLLSEEQKFVIKKIGARFRKLRKEKGKTSYQTLAFENEISTTYLGQVERGKKDFSISYFVTMLSLLDVSLEDFFKGFKEPQKGKSIRSKKVK